MQGAFTGTSWEEGGNTVLDRTPILFYKIRTTPGPVGPAV